jgi:hypothetical protein
LQIPASVPADELLSAFVLNFINIFSISSGSRQTECYFPTCTKPCSLAAIFSDRLLMDTDYKHTPKTDKQLSNWFNEKVRQGKSNFLNPNFAIDLSSKTYWQFGIFNKCEKTIIPLPSF